MKIRSMRELAAFNEMLNRCCGQVWIESPDGEKLDLTEQSTRTRGLSALLGERAEEYGIYARRREDEMLLLDYFCTWVRKTA